MTYRERERLALNACEGCNKDLELLPNGYHVDENGLHTICAFVKAWAVAGENIIACFRNRKTALSRAKKSKEGQRLAIIWEGSGPHQLHIVVEI